MISVVIPTRNRPASLARALAALARQQRLPDEVIVVDASDEPAAPDKLGAAHPTLSITLLRTQPGVCAQRNLGVRHATGDCVLLCDDDIEPTPDYLQTLTDYFERNPAAGAASGLLYEPGGRPAFEAPSLRHLLIAFVFQLSVWADVDAAHAGTLTALLADWYRRRGNTWSCAGWPLITQARGPVVRTATYGLGAALVRRAWLVASPFDERLGPHGIGDNYGVALGFPGELPIHVLTALSVLHHRVPDNRLAAAEAFYQRALALHYFVRTNSRFARSTVAWLSWSLVGKALIAAHARDTALVRATLRALGDIVRGRNPLLTHVRPAERRAPAATSVS